MPCSLFIEKIIKIALNMKNCDNYGSENKKGSRKIGIEAVAKPDYESIYIRGT